MVRPAPVEGLAVAVVTGRDVVGGGGRSVPVPGAVGNRGAVATGGSARSEEHTSELQSDVGAGSALAAALAGSVGGAAHADVDAAAGSSRDPSSPAVAVGAAK